MIPPFDLFVAKPRHWLKSVRDILFLIITIIFMVTAFVTIIQNPHILDIMSEMFDHHCTSLCF